MDRDPQRRDDAPSPAARTIEEELIDKTGRAAGDPDKPVQEKFDELGEQPAVKGPSGRGG